MENNNNESVENNEKLENSYDDEIYENFEISNDNNKDITITVKNPSVVKKVFNSYYIFNIIIKEKENTYNISMRYKNIYLLYKKLKNIYFGIFIPYPHIKEINCHKNFIKERRIYLQNFFNYIKNRNFLYYSSIFQILINDSKNFKSNIKSEKKLSKDELLRFYKTTCFENLNDKSIENLTTEFNIIIEEIDNKLEQFKNLMNKIDNYINCYKSSNTDVNLNFFLNMNFNHILEVSKTENIINLNNIIKNQNNIYLAIILRKLKFIIKEIKIFKNLLENITDLKKKFYKLKDELDVLYKNKDSVKNQEKIKNKDFEVKDNEILLKMILNNIIKNEIKYFENSKDFKFKQIFKIIYKSRIKSINDEIQFLEQNQIN